MDLEVRNLSVAIGGKTIIHDVSAEVKSKRFVGIVGPNGSGKSTTLKTIYRVLKPHSGTVLLDGKALEEVSLKESARRLGVMTQMSTLNFDFRVEEVVLMGRTPHKKLMETDNDEDYALAWKALELVGMEGMANRKFNTLSGGERQRVLMARALTQQPEALILDEPTNHLDIQYQLQILRVVKSLGIEVFAAMHDLNLAIDYCDYLYVMSRGAVVAEGTPETILEPDLIRTVFGVESVLVDVPELKRKTFHRQPAAQQKAHWADQGGASSAKRPVCPGAW